MYLQYQLHVTVKLKQFSPYSPFIILKDKLSQHKIVLLANSFYTLQLVTTKCVLAIISGKK
jgi:hypothetical protein